MPRVSVGLPVYNGENYVEEAVRSLLDQTYADFELIISDNASTDRTEEICRAFAAADPRVTYHRFDRNMGAAHNFNHVVDLARGEYFRWAAHDDVCEPGYLKACVMLLDEDPTVVLCHSRTGRLGPDGRRDGHYDYPVRYGAPRTADRFRDLIVVRHHCITIFGLMRLEVLRRTPLIGAYVASDRVLLAELALHGRLVEVPETLFHRRHHPEVSSALSEQDARLEWFDPALSGRITHPNWRILQEYVRALRRVRPDGAHDCWKALAEHVRVRNRFLRRDLRLAFKMRLKRSAIGRMVYALLVRFKPAATTPARKRRS